MLTEVRKRCLTRDEDCKSNTEDTEVHHGDTGKTGSNIITTKRLTLRAVIFLTIIIVFFLWPTKIDPKSFRFHKAPPFVGALSKNGRLTKASKLYKGLSGPEALAFHNGYLYTGTADGKVIKIRNGNIEVLARFGSCEERKVKEEKCGRPLGLRIDNSGNLLVADSHLGLFRINLKNGSIENLIPANRNINGYKLKFLNDVVVAKSGMIYLTDTSVKWRREEYQMIGLEMNPDGRIIEYNPYTGESMSVCTNINANGIDLGQEEDYLIYSETNFARLSKCYVKGMKRGQVDIWVDNLPGLPDNIRRTTSGSYWVALTITRHPNKPLLPTELYAHYPMLRLWHYKLHMIKSVFGYSGHLSRKLKKTYGLVIEVDADGLYKQSLHDPTGNIVGISHAEEYDGKLFVASLQNDFIAAVDLTDKK